MLVATIALAVVIVGILIYGVIIMSQVSDKIAAQTAAIGVLTTTVAGLDPATPADLAQLDANTTAVNAAVTALGGTPG